MSMFSINSSNAASELFKLSSEVYVSNIQESLRVAQNALAARANKALKKDAVDFSDPRIARPQAERDKLAAQKAQFIDEATLMSKVVTNLGKIDLALTDIKTALLTLNSASTPQERADAAALLDQKILAINGYANNAGDYGKNPIGKPKNASFETSDVIAASSAGSLFVEGKFEGSDFAITDAGGKTWHVDRGTSELVQYDSFPDQPTGTRYATSDVTVASYDDSTGAITLNTPGGQVAGTVQRYGVGMLDSFLYNGLQSDADVARALADLDVAQARFGIDKATFGGAEVTLTSQLNQLNGKIADLDKRINSVTSEMITERTAADKALKTKVQIQQQMLSLTVSSQGAIIDLFFRGSIKTGTILDQ
ncbi:MAG: hypothetical protein IT563_09565 [Alphaproteobacteria bacterium]|nr:hypothetical protein [Alphaproteobacteria bacterium]